MRFPSDDVPREIFQTVEKRKRLAEQPEKSRPATCAPDAGADFFGGKSHFPEEKSLLCSFCGRNSKNSSKNWRGKVGFPLEIQVGFADRIGSNQRFEPMRLVVAGARVAWGK